MTQRRLATPSMTTRGIPHSKAEPTHPLSPGTRLLLPILGVALLIVACSVAGLQAGVPTVGWFNELRQGVVDNVADAERARQAIATIDRVELDLLSDLDTLERHSKRLKELNADFDATRADFEAEFAEMDANSRRVEEMLRGLRVELKTIIQSEEWEGVFDLSNSLHGAYHAQN